jgi:hypothetical protein
MDADEREGPGPRTGRVDNDGRRLLEQSAGHNMKRRCVERLQQSTQRPQRAAVVVVGTASSNQFRW